MKLINGILQPIFNQVKIKEIMKIIMKVKGITISQKISVYKFDRVLNIPLYMTEKRGLGLSIATDDNKISVSGIFSGIT